MTNKKDTQPRNKKTKCHTDLDRASDFEGEEEFDPDTYTSSKPEPKPEQKPEPEPEPDISFRITRPREA